MYWPAYSPNLAPVEIFFRIIKRKLRVNLNLKNIWFDNLQDRIFIYESIKNWKIDEIKYMWIQLIIYTKIWILKYN